MRRITLLVLALVLTALGTPAEAQQVHRERVHFEPGTTGTTIRDRIVGRESFQYVLNARAGQMLRIRLESSRPSVYFNLFAPGDVPGRSNAIYASETGGGNTMEVRLSHSGDHTIQVYQVRAAARRGERVNFTLQVSITGDGAAHARPPHAGRPSRLPEHRESASVRAGQGRFDATGNIRCAERSGQPLRPCRFGVARDPGGSAAVAVTRPSGRSRIIFFEGGRAIGADTAQADGSAGWRFVSRRRGDAFVITLGPERYEIIDAVVFGG